MKRLDRYENRILSAYERGELKSVATSEASLRRYREYATATPTKKRRANIRMSTLDLADIQARAAEEGFPSQTLMVSVLLFSHSLQTSERIGSCATGTRDLPCYSGCPKLRGLRSGNRARRRAQKERRCP